MEMSMVLPKRKVMAINSVPTTTAMPAGTIMPKSCRIIFLAANHMSIPPSDQQPSQL